MGLNSSSHPKRVVKPLYRPPTLILRQALSVSYLAALTRWRRLPTWLLRAPRTLPTVAGATGMGCIGFPAHPVWEITAACNLRCRHCHAEGGKPLPGELSTEQGKKLLRDIAAIDQFRMVVFTGGEPLMRGDIFELVEYGSALGLNIAIATNGTMITTEMAQRLKRAGVCDLAIGLDGATAAIHEFIRGVPGCFERTLRGMYAARKAGLALQINITVMQANYHQIAELLDLCDRLDAEIVLLYQFIPMGRGQEDMELTTDQYSSLMRFVSERQSSARPIIEPTCSPQYWAYLLRYHGITGLRLRLSEVVFKGCVAGSGLCYVKPDGEVWACPFIPISAGNATQEPLGRIWSDSELFRSLRDRHSGLGGKCRRCRYRVQCGGCRGRAYAHAGDYLAEDPLCFLYHSTVSPLMPST